MKKPPDNSLKLGGSDYIIKGNISAQSLSRSIQNALTNFQAFKLANEKQQEISRFALTITHDLRGQDHLILQTGCKGCYR